MNVVAKKICETRKAKGLTQLQLAEKSQVNLRTIQRIENNKGEPRSTTLNLICNALQLDVEKLTMSTESQKQIEIGSQITSGLFLILLNFILMGIIGFLTLDSNANTNSRLGAFLVSICIPIFIVLLTRKMNGMERMLKFGFGYIAYFFLVIMILGLPIGFSTGLFPCLLLSLSILYFGQELIKYGE